MVKFIMGVIVGILIFFFFVYFGGGKTLKKVGYGLTDTGHLNLAGYRTSRNRGRDLSVRVN